ncbi:hypothetical protein CTI14_42080, partial [Methylobacterium radiotolerans]
KEFTMIPVTALRRIQALPEDAMVLMAVLNDNPSLPDNEGNGFQTRVKQRMNDEGVPPSVMNQVLEDLSAARRSSGRSRLYVVGADLFERHARSHQPSGQLRSVLKEFTMIPVTALRRIQALPEDAMVLMAVLNDNPS